MHGRKISAWLQLIGVAGGSLALIAGAAVVLANASGNGTAPGDAQLASSSAVLSKQEELVANQAQGAAAPSLLEILQSAQALADAGKLPPQPTLLEILRSAQALADAGKLRSPPSLLEILQSAQVLADAGKLPSPAPPSLLEILQSAQALADAGKLPGEQPRAEPPLAPVEQPAVSSGAATGWYNDAYSARVRDLVNGERARVGLPPVAVDERLVKAAGAYAQVLAANNWFSHTGPDGSTFVARIEAAGFPFTVRLGEVLAWGSNSWPAESLVRMWMASPTHREEILSPVYTRAGTRCYFTAARGVTVRCVMEFAG